jgi:thiol-disulfide isomerase/thioredoxin
VLDISIRILCTLFLILFTTISKSSASQFEVPELELRNLSGEVQTLSQFRGQVVILNFWATWCVPCRKEIPLFVELQRIYADRGIQFIGASTEDWDQRENINKFVESYKINYPIWLGATSEQQASFRLATAMPATIIIDKAGRGCFRIIGESSRSDLVSRIEFLLSEDSGTPPRDLVLPEGITPEHFREHELGLEDKHHEENELSGADSEVPS